MTFSLTIKTAEEKQAEAEAALRDQMASVIDGAVEAQARALGYNSAAHCASYVNSTVPAWATEATAFVAWRDAVWQAVFALEVDPGAAMLGTEALLAALPAWPG